MTDRTTLLILAIPAVALAVGALLRSVPGEWSQSALLAWTAVSLGFLLGQAGETTLLAAAGLASGFLVLAVGGTAGLGLLAAVYAVVVVLALTGVVAVFWPTAAVLAVSCAAGAARGLIH